MSSRLNQPWQMDEPQKPEPIGSPHPFLTRVQCTNELCGIHFHFSVIRTESKVTEDSKHVEYEKVLKEYIAWNERQAGFASDM
jgi:hypothetical protein